MQVGKLFILSAPSGTGKTTLVVELVERLKGRYALERIITYTTKKPRASEVHGKDYHFISEEEFRKKIDEGFFLEWSIAYGAYYGSPKNILQELNNGTSFIAVLDRQGAQAVKKQANACILIWLRPPTLEDLKNRLCTRAQDSQEVIQYRLELAQKELEEELHSPLFDHTVINDDFNDALTALITIVAQTIA